MHRLEQIMAAALVAGAMSLFSTAAQATTITVDSTDDDMDFNNGTCSLREATVSASTNSTTDNCPAGSTTFQDEIVFDNSIFDAEGKATIQLSTGISLVDGSLAINGPSNKTLTIIGNGSTWIFELALTAGPVYELANLTLKGGNNTSVAGGAVAIGGEVDRARFTNVRFIDNHSDHSGGAIGFEGSRDLQLDVFESTFENNSASSGGAIGVHSDSLLLLNVQQNVFSGNSATSKGGAVSLSTFGSGSDDDIAEFRRNRFVQNAAPRAGAVFVAPATADGQNIQADFISNAFEDNQATAANGGGIEFVGSDTIDPDSTLILRRNSFINNLAQVNGSAVSINSAPFNLVNNLFAMNTAGVTGALHLEGTSITDLGTADTLFNTFLGNTAGSATSGQAALDIRMYFPDYAATTITLLANAHLTNVEDEGDAPCDFEVNDSTIFGIGSIIEATQNALACSPLSGITVVDDIRLSLIDVNHETHSQVAEPQPGSPLIDVVQASVCSEDNGATPLHRDILDARRDLDDVPFNGDPRTDAKCDTGSFEVDEGRLLTVDRDGTGSGTVTSVPENIDCGSTCVGAFPVGSSIDLIASADAGSVFAGWSGACSGTSACNVALNEDKSVTATFDVAPSHTVAVDVLGDGDGEITSTPSGIQCPGTCSADFQEGTDVTLHAAAGANAAFSGWGGDCAGEATTDCGLSVTGDLSATATFEATKFTLEVSVTGGGTGLVASNPGLIICPTMCTYEFDRDEAVVLTAEADTGSRFAGWSGDCAASGADTCDLVMDQHRTIGAEFEEAADAIFTDRFESPTASETH